MYWDCPRQVIHWLKKKMLRYSISLLSYQCLTLHSPPLICSHELSFSPSWLCLVWIYISESEWKQTDEDRNGPVSPNTHLLKIVCLFSDLFIHPVVYFHWAWTSKDNSVFPLFCFHWWRHSAEILKCSCYFSLLYALLAVVTSLLSFLLLSP